MCTNTKPATLLDSFAAQSEVNTSMATTPEDLRNADKQIREEVKNRAAETLEDVRHEHKRRTVGSSDATSNDTAALKDQALRDLVEHVKKFK
jgi:hypothetical protein